jgi:hypothetical protein
MPVEVITADSLIIVAGNKKDEKQKPKNSLKCLKIQALLQLLE